MLYSEVLSKKGLDPKSIYNTFCSKASRHTHTLKNHISIYQGNPKVISYLKLQMNLMPLFPSVVHSCVFPQKESMCEMNSGKYSNMKKESNNLQKAEKRYLYSFDFLER